MLLKRLFNKDKYDREEQLNEQVNEKIEKYNYTVEHIKIDTRSFGNVIIILSRENLMLRLVKDRGVISVDIGYKSIRDEWLDVLVILRLSNINDYILPEKEPEILEYVINLLEKYPDVFNDLKYIGPFYNMKRRIAQYNRNKSTWWNN